MVYSSVLVDSWHKGCSSKPVNVSSNVPPLEEELTDSQVRRFGKAQILIAEDDPTIAQDLKYKIENLDYEDRHGNISARTRRAQVSSMRPVEVQSLLV